MENREKIRLEISEILGKEVESLKDDVEFSNMGVDSFSLINMIMELQEIFKVRLNQEDLASIKNLGLLLDLVESRMK